MKRISEEKALALIYNESLVDCPDGTHNWAYYISRKQGVAFVFCEKCGLLKVKYDDFIKNRR